ncbi:MAG: CCA tRNA nucleotidyltransferase [Armatimonadota bacterium]|nr:CCA tRNA nucleotidyltransferase [Armatimonadota bacterium]
MQHALTILREATKNTPYEGKLYVVGGAVRAKYLPPDSRNRHAESSETENEDVDIVLEGNALELAEFLFSKGVCKHKPVAYPRFGTAMITIGNTQVELASARKESYEPTSRKPYTEPATLLDDVMRRDFTINTLLENLHTGEVMDLTGKALADIRDRIIRTPRDPEKTFEEDPLRMLRAIRFATRLGFSIHEETFNAIRSMAHRLEIVSPERIRDEFVKILMSANAAWGLEKLLESSLLQQFAPELAAMRGVTQNVYHLYDVWTHTLKTVEAISPDEGLLLRLAALLHDIGKVQTRTVDEQGNVHFYGHQTVGAKMARDFLQRLRFPNSLIDKVAFLILMHLRVGEYHNQWSDAAVRRLIRDLGDLLEEAIKLTQADKAAANPDAAYVDLEELKRRIAKVREEMSGRQFVSPLNGNEIMAVLGIGPGPEVGALKAFLESEVVDGRLKPGDKAAAVELLRRKYFENKSAQDSKS